MKEKDKKEGQNKKPKVDNLRLSDKLKAESYKRFT